jgi:DNA polymerase epsilon subunit 1
MREFHEDSQFKDPSPSFVLRDVICTFCCSCRDIDLLRDEQLISPGVKDRWLCNHCNNDIDVTEIENRSVLF